MLGCGPQTIFAFAFCPGLLWGWWQICLWLQAKQDWRSESIQCRALSSCQTSNQAADNLGSHQCLLCLRPEVTMSRETWPPRQNTASKSGMQTARRGAQPCFPLNVLPPTSVGLLLREIAAQKSSLLNHLRSVHKFPAWHAGSVSTSFLGSSAHITTTVKIYVNRR